MRQFVPSESRNDEENDGQATYITVGHKNFAALKLLQIIEIICMI